MRNGKKLIVVADDDREIREVLSLLLGGEGYEVLTAANAALYGILCSCVHSLGYSPYLGFIHSGSPLPFVYDLADLYKGELCVDLAFSLTLSMAGKYNKYTVAEAFRKRVIAMDLLTRVPADIESLIGEKSARRYRK